MLHQKDRPPMNPIVVTASALALLMAATGCNKAAAPEPKSTHEAQAAKTGQEYDMAGTSAAQAADPATAPARARCCSEDRWSTEAVTPTRTST